MPTTVTAIKPDDKIRALFAKIYDRKKSFKFTHRKLHETFYNLRRNPEYRILLNEFLFNDNYTYPVCDLLDEILSEMQFTGIITKVDPKVRDINFKQDDVLAEVLNSLGDGKKIIFERMSNDFLAAIDKK
jgi:hypothetical protein